MSSEEDRGAIDRFVAGAAVDANALAAAITANAVDRTVVVEALLKGLEDPEPLVRRRTALRIAGMPEIDNRLAARLAVTALSDDDDGCRHGAAAALRSHALPVPGERTQPATSFSGRRPLLLLRAAALRSAASGLELTARYREDAPDLATELVEAHGGDAQAELRGLPRSFAGTRPVLRARVAPPPEPLTPIGRAANPVSADGAVTIRIPLDGASLDKLVEWLMAGVDLVVPDD